MASHAVWVFFYPLEAPIMASHAVLIAVIKLYMTA